MKTLYFIVILTSSICQSVLATNTEQTALLEHFVQYYLEQAEIAIPITIATGDTIRSQDEAETTCSGIGEQVKCTVTVNAKALEKASTLDIEYYAAHETCHLKLEHYTLSVFDHVQLRDKIELEADQCAFLLLGADKFLVYFTEQIYQRYDPNRTVPVEKLQSALTRIYGPE